MSKTSRELIEFCKGKLGTPYVFGMKGQGLTETAGSGKPQGLYTPVHN